MAIDSSATTEPHLASDLPRRWWSTAAWAAALVVLVLAVYSRGISNGLVSDDRVCVESNFALRSLEGLRVIWFKLGTIEQYYPLVHSMFWVEYHLWGLDPRGYHFVNIMLHAVAAVLIWRLLVRLSVPGAWLAAAIFAVHPVHVESVAWIAERKNTLSCVLALGSILAYLRFSPPETSADDPIPIRNWRVSTRWPRCSTSWRC